jgi:uncharacterized protein (TIGR02145 family)
MIKNIIMMKRISTLLAAFFITISLFGQSPSSFKYQAVLRDIRGNIKVNTNTTIIISILQGSASGTSVYSETHTATTDGFGLINLEIGKGTVTIGTFGGINWGSGTYFVKVTVDGVEMGTSQLLSVPYAMYATKAGNGFSGSYTDLTNKPNFATVATSGSYGDLLNKPALFDGTWSSLTGKPTLATVATSGSYSDLANKPVLFDSSYASLKGKPSLSTVATSGKYGDLINKPALFDSSYANLKGKPSLSTVATSGKYSDLTNKPALFDSSYASLKGKPSLSTVATSGSYNDLSNKPTYDTVNHLIIKGKTADLGEALFEVKNKNGQTVFAVYNEGVRIYVDDGAKGSKGGFAIGGFGTAKAPSQNYFVVNGDSIRAYIDDDPLKGTKGGFAIGGFGAAKATREEYLRVTADSTRLNFNETNAKGSKGGFAIGGFSPAKGGIQDLLTINASSIRMYINDNPTKGSKGGFAIGGFDNVKGITQEYLKVTRDSSRLYFNDAPAKGTKGGFAIGGFNPAKGGTSDYLLINPDSSNFYVRSQGQGSSSFNIVSFDPDLGWSSIMTANPDTINMTGVLSLENDFSVEGNINYSGTVARDTTPDLMTMEVIDITSNTATGGGDIISNGGTAVIVSGICWSTSPNPTTSGNKTTDGASIGSFTSDLTALTYNTTYHVRAYATNNKGTAYGNEVTFTTNPVIPTLTTAAVTSISADSARSGGNISNNGGAAIIERGICWSTTSNPTIADYTTLDGTGTGSFVSSLTGLTDNTAYFVRAYATNSAGTAYGNQVSFTTVAITLPVLTTAAITGITTSSASSGGNITSDGGATVIDRGVCWSSSANPTIADYTTLDGTGLGSFISSITGLISSTTYYVRAYATNSKGTAYGNELTFTTTAAGATVQDIDGNVYNTVTIGTQTWTVENLMTTRFDDGTPIPLVTDNSVWASSNAPAYCWFNNDAATYQATYGALYNWYSINPVSNGGKNICPTGWHAPTDPDWTSLTTFLGGLSVAGGKLKETGTLHWQTPNTGATNETGFSALPGGSRDMSGAFTPIGTVGYFWTVTMYSPIEGWNRNIDYNSNGVNSFYNYKQSGFSVRCLMGAAAPVLPTLFTAPASSITQTTAVSGGDIMNDGGAPVTARGVCWSTSPAPTVASSKTTDGSGMGIFSSNISGLLPTTFYFVRAYATNSAGTAYGPEQTFMTTAK